jgi:uncharacterized protein (TIGR02391 family)
MPGFDLIEGDLLALPVDAVGLAVLRDVVDNEETNIHNWHQAARHGYSQRGLDVLTEGWGWLLQNGLVAMAPDQVFRQGAVIVTRLGRSVATEGMERVKAARRLDVDLLPAIAERVRPQFLLGEYDLAAFAALRTVEVRVRVLAGAPESLIGVKLMQFAFRPEEGNEGPLTDKEADPGEKVARMELFKGAIGLFKNPTSHRDVAYDSPTEASEVVLLADLLMRILDRIAAERESP